MQAGGVQWAAEGQVIRSGRLRGRGQSPYLKSQHFSVSVSFSVNSKSSVECVTVYSSLDWCFFESYSSFETFFQVVP